MAKLSAADRRALPASTFALPEKRAYPIPDHGHAVAALSEVEQHGTPEEKSRVRAAVRRKFKDMTVERKSAKAGTRE